MKILSYKLDNVPARYEDIAIPPASARSAVAMQSEVMAGHLAGIHWKWIKCFTT